MRKTQLVAALLICVSVYSSNAAAQVWLADRANGEGPGFKLGDSLVLHTGLGLEGGFDSNANYTHENTMAGRLIITPYVDLATRPNSRRAQDQPGAPVAEKKATLRTGLAMSWDMYFGDEATMERYNSGGNPLGIDLTLHTVILPERKVSFLTDIIYVRTLEPYETAADAQTLNDITGGIGLRIKPGGGTLTFEPGYRIQTYLYADDRLAAKSNKLVNEVSFRSRWNVFPKTALVSNIFFSPTLYLGENTENVNSLPVRTYFGVQGLLTPRFGLRFVAGYGGSFYETGPNFDSVIGDIELSFYLSPTARIALGAKRDFVDSMYSNYFEQNGGYLSYDQLFGGRFMATLKGELYSRQYASFGSIVTDPDTGSTLEPNFTERADLWIESSLLLEYRINDWLSLHASGEIEADITDFTYDYTSVDVDGDTRTELVEASFFKFEAFGGIRVHY